MKNSFKPKKLVKYFTDGSLPFGTYLNAAGVGVAALSDGHGELLEEDRQRAQLAREDEVEEGPQLLEVVLQGRPGEDEAVCRGEGLGGERHLRVGVPNEGAVFDCFSSGYFCGQGWALRIHISLLLRYTNASPLSKVPKFSQIHVVPDLVALVEDDVVEVMAEELVPVRDDAAVAADEDAIGGCDGADEGGAGAAVRARLVQDDDAEERPPLVELLHPLVHHGRRADDEDGPETPATV